VGAVATHPGHDLLPVGARPDGDRVDLPGVDLSEVGADFALESEPDPLPAVRPDPSSPPPPPPTCDPLPLPLPLPGPGVPKENRVSQGRASSSPEAMASRSSSIDAVNP